MIDIPKRLKLIYAPKGEAAEYAELAWSIRLAMARGGYREGLAEPHSHTYYLKKSFRDAEAH